MPKCRFLQVCCALMLVFVLAQGDKLAFAKLSDGEMGVFSSNDVMFYDPSICVEEGWAGDNLFEKTLTYLLSKGLTKEATAGVYGNLMANGMSGGALINHEDGTSEMKDLGTYVVPIKLLIDEDEIKNLNDETVRHGVGFLQYRYSDRIEYLNYLRDKGELDRYTREWDDDSGKYAYDGMSYQQMIGAIGREKVEALLKAELDYIYDKMEKIVITADAVAGQNVGKYGIVVGENLSSAINKIDEPSDAAEFFNHVIAVNDVFDLSNGGIDDYAYEGYTTIVANGFTDSGGSNRCHETGGRLIAKKAVELAWPYADGTCKHDGKMVDWVENNSICDQDIKPEFESAMQNARIYGGINLKDYTFCGTSSLFGLGLDKKRSLATDCGVFVGTVILNSGVDDGFPRANPIDQFEHMCGEKDEVGECKGTDEWRPVKKADNTNDLKPGDIIVTMYENGYKHIEIYVGDYSRFGQVAEAKECSYTAKMTDVVTLNGEYAVFRSKHGAEIITPVYPLDEDSVDVDCAPGTEDLGVRDDAYIYGRNLTIRVCAVQNFLDYASTASAPKYEHDIYHVEGQNGKLVVNSRVSGAYHALAEAIMDAGMDMPIGAGFRTMAGQEKLFYKVYAGTGRASAPGFSNHQAGLAVDISGTCTQFPFSPKECDATGNPLSLFLAEYAGDYGLTRTNERESWHVAPFSKPQEED